MPKCYLINMNFMKKNRFIFHCARILRRFWLPAAAGLLLLGSGIRWVLTILAEPAELVAVYREVALPGLPEEQDGLKIAVLSDLHLRPALLRTDLLPRAAALIARKRPDLILLVGDYYNRYSLFGNLSMPEITRELRRFHLLPGRTFAVTGNHDTTAMNKGLREAIQHTGIRLLEYENTTLILRGRPLQLAGINDFHTDPACLARAFAGLDRSRPILLLAHNPELFVMPDNVADLTISGHTHGGQIRLPLVGANYLPRRAEQFFDRGLFRKQDGRQLVVTSGLGTSLLPARWNCPPEVLFLTLHPAPEQKKTAPPRPEAGERGSGKTPLHNR